MDSQFAPLPVPKAFLLVPLKVIEIAHIVVVFLTAHAAHNEITRKVGIQHTQIGNLWDE